MLGGALLGLIVALGVVGVFWYMASKKQPSFDLPVARTDTFDVDLAPAAVIAKLTEAAPAMGLKVALADDKADRVILEDGMSINNYGSFLKITAAADGTGAAVTVDLMNKAPQWGPVVTKKHRTLTEKVKGALGL